MENSQEQDKRIKFLNEVWRVLQEEKDNNIIREFINRMAILNDEYRFNGGIYPDVDFVLSVAKDEINMLKKEIEQIAQMEKNEEISHEEKMKQIKENFLKRFEKTKSEPEPKKLKKKKLKKKKV